MFSNTVWVGDFQLLLFEWNMRFPRHFTEVKFHCRRMSGLAANFLKYGKGKSYFLVCTSKFSSLGHRFTCCVVGRCLLRQLWPVASIPRALQRHSQGWHKAGLSGAVGQEARRRRVQPSGVKAGCDHLSSGSEAWFWLILFTCIHAATEPKRGRKDYEDLKREIIIKKCCREKKGLKTIFFII